MYNPTAKILHPDFSRPNVRPIGDVEIDWSNMMTRGLVAAYLLDGSGILRDIAKNHNGTILGTPVGRVDAKGKHVLLNGTNAAYSIPDHADLDFGANDDCTIAALTKPNATNQDSELFEKQLGNPLYQVVVQSDMNGGNWWWQVRDTGGTLISAESTTQYAIGRYDQIMCRRDAGTTIDISINGVQEDSTVDTTGDWSNATPLLIGNGNGGFYSGTINYLYIFRRRLTDFEGMSIYRNPYQLLAPKTNFFFVPQEVAAVGSIMNQMQQANLGSDLYNGVIQ